MIIRFMKQNYIILWMQLVMLNKIHYGVLFETSSYVSSLNISNQIINLSVDVCNEMADKFSKVFSDVFQETINHYQVRNDGSCEAF